MLLKATLNLNYRGIINVIIVIIIFWFFKATMDFLQEINWTTFKEEEALFLFIDWLFNVLILY